MLTQDEYGWTALRYAVRADNIEEGSVFSRALRASGSVRRPRGEEVVNATTARTLNPRTQTRKPSDSSEVFSGPVARPTVDLIAVGVLTEAYKHEGGA